MIKELTFLKNQKVISMKRLIICIFLFSVSIPLFAQNDTTDDTWHIENGNDVTNNPSIVTDRLGIGPVNMNTEDGLHLYGKPLHLQYPSGVNWRVISSGGGTFWIQNVTNNLNPFRMESSGRLGLGTGASITPQAQVHVKSYNHRALLVQGGVNQGAVPIFQVVKDDYEPIFSIIKDRKIGIGTTVPTASLEISPSDSIEYQTYNAFKIKGHYNTAAAEIINTYTGSGSGGLTIETSETNGTADALHIKTNRLSSPKTMIRIPNYSTSANYVLLAEDGGNVGIGTSNPQNALDVCGHIRATEVVIESDWCDYVFDKNYQLPTLQEQKAFIKKNGHLKNFDSEEEMAGQIEVGDVSTKQQKTLEEVMLYLIEMEEKMTDFQKENERLQERVTELEAALKKK